MRFCRKSLFIKHLPHWTLTTLLFGGIATADQLSVPEFGIVLPQGVLISVNNPRPGERNEVFDLLGADAWLRPAPMDQERSRYREALVTRLGEGGLRPDVLLERQRALYAAQKGRPGQRESENTRKVLEGKAGHLRPVNALEWAILRLQAHRFPLIEHPTEFAAFIFRSGDRLRIYLSGSDSVGVKFRGEVKDRMKADQEGGWTLVANLHNHPFLFDRVAGDRMYTTEDSREDIGGALAPSLTDVQLWRNLRSDCGLPEAWITNGLDSCRFAAKDFDALDASD